ncbi:36228_t:CDS:1, partial [Racocetra persica]
FLGFVDVNCILCNVKSATSISEIAVVNVIVSVTIFLVLGFVDI